jgi:phosphoglycerate dehydrogenase-like enzyme
VRIAISIHEPPVWTFPAEQVHRIQAALPDDEVVDARDPEVRAREIEHADVLVAFRVTPAEFARFARVRWIQSTAVGVAELLIPDIVASDIVVTNVRGVHAGYIAEHAIALVLALRRQIHTAVRRQGGRQWAQTELQAARVRPISDSHLVVVGLGAIGSRVAALGRGLGMRVTGVRRRPDLPGPPGDIAIRGRHELLDVLPDADAVVLAAPGTADTRALIGQPELAAMRPSAVLVNVARGRLIDDAALVQALDEGRLAGAALDAFAREPLPADHPYWQLPNVLMTPHTAPFGGDYWASAADLFLENVGRFRRGEPLLNVVDKTLGY